MMKWLVIFSMLLCSNAFGQGILGHQDSAGISSNPASGEGSWALGPFEALSSGTVDSIAVWVESGTGTNFTLGIYTDDAGDPDALMADGAETVNTTGWNVVVLDSPVDITGGTDYWLAAAHEDNGMFWIYDVVSDFSRRSNGATYTAGVMLDPWPASSTTGTRKYGIFAYYTAAGAGITKKLGAVKLDKVKL